MWNQFFTLNLPKVYFLKTGETLKCKFKKSVKKKLTDVWSYYTEADIVPHIFS